MHQIWWKLKEIPKNILFMNLVPSSATSWKSALISIVTWHKTTINSASQHKLLWTSISQDSSHLVARFPKKRNCEPPFFRFGTPLGMYNLSSSRTDGSRVLSTSPSSHHHNHNLCGQANAVLNGPFACAMRPARGTRRRLWHDVHWELVVGQPATRRTLYGSSSSLWKHLKTGSRAHGSSQPSVRKFLSVFAHLASVCARGHFLSYGGFACLSK